MVRGCRCTFNTELGLLFYVRTGIAMTYLLGAITAALACSRHSYKAVLPAPGELSESRVCLAMQAGVWDVDGTGMQAVDDPEVDLGIRKVSAFPENTHIPAQHCAADHTMLHAGCWQLWL